MELKRKAFFILIIILSSKMKMCLYGAPPPEEGIINKDLTGQDLIKMGKSLNKPLLALLGATFVKMQQNINKLDDKTVVSKNNLQNGIDKLTLELCKETRCAAWSEWTQCSAYKTGTFGARTRSRNCGGSSSICSTVSSETVETDNQICQGKCNYTLTANKYCIKLYKNVTKTQKDAQADCHKDGGYLMNIDSEMKVKDVNEYFTNISFSHSVWIDGTRTLPNGDWKYEYGSTDTNFSLWHGSEPDSTDDCKVYEYLYDKKWYGRPCERTYYTLCEIL